METSKYLRIKEEDQIKWKNSPFGREVVKKEVLWEFFSSLTPMENTI